MCASGNASDGDVLQRETEDDTPRRAGLVSEREDGVGADATGPARAGDAGVQGAGRAAVQGAECPDRAVLRGAGRAAAGGGVPAAGAGGARMCAARARAVGAAAGPAGPGAQRARTAAAVRQLPRRHADRAHTRRERLLRCRAVRLQDCVGAAAGQPHARGGCARRHPRDAVGARVRWPVRAWHRRVCTFPARAPCPTRDT